MLQPLPSQGSELHHTHHVPTPQETIQIREIRQRAWDIGWCSLSDAELLALLIRTDDARSIVAARSLLHASENCLDRLGRLSLSALAKVPGVGNSTATLIGAALELGRRRRERSPDERTLVASSAVAYEVLRPLMADLGHEEFWLLLLDRGNRLLARLRVSVGGLHGTVADPKVIFRVALERGASSMVLAHNHPSGQVRPSEDDMQLTRKLVEAGRLLEICVQDHVIVTAHGYYSFADCGMM